MTAAEQIVMESPLVAESTVAAGRWVDVVDDASSLLVVEKNRADSMESALTVEDAQPKQLMEEEEEEEESDDEDIVSEGLLLKTAMLSSFSGKSWLKQEMRTKRSIHPSLNCRPQAARAMKLEGVSLVLSSTPRGVILVPIAFFATSVQRSRSIDETGSAGADLMLTLQACRTTVGTRDSSLGATRDNTVAPVWLVAPPLLAGRPISVTLGKGRRLPRQRAQMRRDRWTSITTWDFRWGCGELP